MECAMIFFIGPDFVKASVFNTEGTELLSAYEDIGLSIKHGCITQVPDKWEDAISKMIQNAVDSDSAIDIKYIAVTYIPGTMVCIDSSGLPVMDAIFPYDGRGRYEAHLYNKYNKKHKNRTDFPWTYNVIPKLLWIKYNRPDIYKKIFKVLTPDSYISYKLTGETAIDNYSAMQFGCDSNNFHYDGRLLDNFGLEKDIFPAICKTGECTGMIAGVVKEKLGLKSEVKMLAVSSFILPLLLASEDMDKNTILYDANSSSICFKYNSHKARLSGEIRKSLFRIEDKYIIIGNFEYMTYKWLKKYTKIDALKSDDYTPGSNGLIVVPYIIGDSLFQNFDIDAGIIGVNTANCGRDILAASYESQGYSLRKKIDILTDCGLNIENIILADDVKDSLKYNIISDITGKEIRISKECDLITRYAFESLFNKEHDLESEDEVITPDREKGIRYNVLFSLYKSAYNSLGDYCRFERKIQKKL
ncbi:MAG: FGGY family carbohydrate kinase [Clostridiales bacterium]|nr:FGGY family carbohydrate kinase [Clostridiales bacterium]